MQAFKNETEDSRVVPPRYDNCLYALALVIERAIRHEMGTSLGSRQQY